MKEEWLEDGAAVPVTCETVTELIAEIKRLIDVVGGMALAQPEQEPVAYINVDKRSLEWASPTRWLTPTVAKMERVALYTTPPQRPLVGLTDAEAESAIDEISGFAFGLDDGNVSNATVVLYAKAIEATLKAKNT